jgi:phage host-nuclease inhibitor protein Gam
VVRESIRSKIVRLSNRVLRRIGTTKKMRTVRNIGDLTRDSLRLTDIMGSMIIKGNMNIACHSNSLG